MQFRHGQDGGASGSGSESDSAMEWEEVLQSQPAASTSRATTPTGPGADQEGIEVTLKPGNGIKTSSKGKGKGKDRQSGFSAQAALDRAHRQDLHKVHAASLLISGHIRNGWLNDKILQARLMSKVPLGIQNKFHEYSKTTHPKATDRSRLFEGAVRGLVGWWSEKFRIEDKLAKNGENEASLLSLFATPCSFVMMDFAEMEKSLACLPPRERTRLLMPFAEDSDLFELLEAFPSREKSSKKKEKAPRLPKLISSELGELIRNSQSLAKRALKMSGTKDISAQLFTSLCRALDIPARLVCALPCIDYRSASKLQKDEKAIDIRTGGSGKKRKRRTSISDRGDDEGDEVDEEEFEEVPIPDSMPSRSVRKTASKLGHMSDSAATSLQANGKRERRGEVSASYPSENRKRKARMSSVELGEHMVYPYVFWSS